jgi:K+-sensing histidine kinase KdpD
MRARLRRCSGAPAAPSLGLGILVAGSFIVVETLGMLVLRQLSPLEVFGTLYLLGVVVVSTVWGLVLAMATSVVSAIVLDYFRHWPDRHFAFNLENGVVIIGFLVVALLTNFVVGLARARAVEADQRRREASALAEQHASLRRVATLVARGVAPRRVE